MDLDPGDDVAWDETIAAAKRSARKAQRRRPRGFVKTSGGKGLHIVSPLKPKADMAGRSRLSPRRSPTRWRPTARDRFVATIAKAKRKGKILVDYLRNQRGATAVAAYSTRARPGAAVSMPLAWEELGSGVGPASLR